MQSDVSINLATVCMLDFLQINQKTLVFRCAGIWIVHRGCQIINQWTLHTSDETPMDGNAYLVNSLAADLQTTESLSDKGRSIDMAAGSGKTHGIAIFDTFFLEKMKNRLQWLKLPLEALTVTMISWPDDVSAGNKWFEGFLSLFLLQLEENAAVPKLVQEVCPK